MPMRLPSPGVLLSNLTNNLNGHNQQQKNRGNGFGSGPPTGKVFEQDDDDANAQQQHQLPRTRSRVNLHASHKKQHVGLSAASSYGSPNRAKKAGQKILEKLGSGGKQSKSSKGKSSPYAADVDGTATPPRRLADDELDFGSPEHQKPTHHRFRTTRKVGAGTFSTVHLAVHIKTTQPVALKILSRQKIKSLKTADRVKAEIKHLRLCAAHPHITRLYDTIDARGAPTLDLVMEYVSGGDMYDYLRTRKRKLKLNGKAAKGVGWFPFWRRGAGLDEPDARRYFQQLVSAIDFMHARGVVHRDLKLENVLLDASKRYIKLADFGLSAYVEDGASTRLVTPCGSPHYAAPEVIVGMPYLGPPTDVWSCGVILYALLTGKLPFVETDMKKQFRKIKDGTYTIPSYLSLEARNMIEKMMTVRVHRRLTVETVQQHLWFQEGLPEYLNCTPEETERRERKAIDEEVMEEVLTLYEFEGRKKDAGVGAGANGSRRGGGIAFADDTKVGSDKGEDLSRAGLERAIALGGGLDNTMTAQMGYGETMRDAHTAYQLLLDAKHYKQRLEELFGTASSRGDGSAGSSRSGLCARAFRSKGIVAIMLCLALTICTQTDVCGAGMGRSGFNESALVKIREGLGLGNATWNPNTIMLTLKSQIGGGNE